jgi:prolyl-tRNA editing enzyme YbaK/EbsC (Cys-tRNA(Pro) deacylase)
MSKSLRRVQTALQDAGLSVEIRETDDSARTAEGAAAAVGCAVDQIAKSIIFRGEASGHVVLFLTAGGNRVDPAKATAVAGQVLGKADADLIRAETGFAIGGVAPLGHLQPDRGLSGPAPAGIRHRLGGRRHAAPRLCHRARRPVAGDRRHAGRFHRLR